MTVHAVPAAEHAVGAVRSAGRWCLVAGLLGAASGIWLAVVTPQVADVRYSYPLDSGAFTAIQVFFFVQHLGLLAGIVGLGRSGAVGSSRAGHWGVVAASGGMLLLTATELLAITAADSLYPGPGTGLLDALYGISSLATGAGLVVAGVAVLRARRWQGPRRWAPVAVGAYVFVPMTPLLFGPFVLARLAIVGWMLLFSVLGAALLHAELR